ncbi:hypothetical protein D3C81_2053260 [compost metagenome]
MGNQHGVTGLELGSDGLTVVGDLLLGERARLLGVQMGLDQELFGNLRHVCCT